MTQRFDDDPYRDLYPSLEPQFAALLARHKEAAGKNEWSYHQFLPLGTFLIASSCSPLCIFTAGRDTGGHACSGVMASTP